MQENHGNTFFFCFFFEMVKHIDHKTLRLWFMSNRKVINGSCSNELNIFLKFIEQIYY